MNINKLKFPRRIINCLLYYRTLKKIEGRIKEIEGGIRYIFDTIHKNNFKDIQHEMHEMRTIMLEQYRIIQDIQLEKSPDGLLRKINEKLPGFSTTMYDLYKKLDQI